MYFMTQQNQNPETTPEQGKRIEITEADLGPIEIDVEATNLVNGSVPIDLDESDFPTEVTPEKIVLGKSDFGEEERTVISEDDLTVPSEGKIGHEEMEAAKTFKGFVGKFLPEEVAEYTAADQKIKEREASYSVRSEGQYIPITRAHFVEYSEEIHDLDGPPSNYTGVEIYGEGDERLRDLRYDELKGFVTVDTNGDHKEVEPSEAIELVTLLDAANDRGDLTPIKPAKA